MRAPLRGLQLRSPTLPRALQTPGRELSPTPSLTLASPLLAMLVSIGSPAAVGSCSGEFAARLLLLFCPPGVSNWDARSDRCGFRLFGHRFYVGETESRALEEGTWRSCVCV